MEREERGRSLSSISTKTGGAVLVPWTEEPQRILHSEEKDEPQMDRGSSRPVVELRNPGDTGACTFHGSIHT